MSWLAVCYRAKHAQRKRAPKKTAAPMTAALPLVSASLPEPAFCGALLTTPEGEFDTAATPAERVVLVAEELPVSVAREELDVDVEDADVTVVSVVGVLEDDDELLLAALLLDLDPEALLVEVEVVSLEPSVLTMMLSLVPDASP